ncbi:amidohydrolase [Hypericibacter adhaerens]|uniref:Amidohydrolase n=1 Tax=Hypericibacter adhaerens TaxID=2602016 RepID=A0A5J6N0Q9_9PROT|nr:amidohydrolase family protein [Hypericibacter adhaerens]QEX23572.1 amidohydrolase [Hypericibacter adhaerens]
MTTIFDYSITAPTEELVASYHPYPPHLANYERVYRNSTDHGELALFRGKPLAKFFEFLDSQGIGRICVKARDIRTTFNLTIPNEAVASLVADYPDRVVGFAGADPHRGKIAVTEFEHAIRKMGLRGLNLQLYELKLAANDRKIYPLYEKCVELNVPVNVHVSINFSTKSLMRYGHPLALDEVAVDFPDLRIIAGPPGWPWVQELIGVAWRHPNVYIAIESVRPNLLLKQNSGYEPLLTYGNSVLGDKIIFGSGWPLLPLARTVQEARSLPLKPANMRGFLADNAQRAVFGA